VRTALNSCPKNQGPHLDWRVGALIARVQGRDSTAKIARLLTDARKQGKVIEVLAAGDDR